MSQERYQQVMYNYEEKLTEEEMNNGWHFCWEYDGLLVNAHDPEMRETGCHCLDNRPGFKFGCKPFKDTDERQPI